MADSPNKIPNIGYINFKWSYRKKHRMIKNSVNAKRDHYILSNQLYVRIPVFLMVLICSISVIIIAI